MLYRKIRAKMREHDYTQEQFAGLLGFSCQQVLSLRMSGKVPWRVTEMYCFLDLFDIPHSELHIYFPPGGKAESIDTVKRDPRMVLVPWDYLEQRIAEAK